MKAKTIIHLRSRRTMDVVEALEVVSAAYGRSADLIRVTKLVDGQPRNTVVNVNAISYFERA